jgi:DNA-binding NtrC family response regulator
MKKTVLFVDDNPLLLNAYSQMLADDRERWEVMTTSDVGKALLWIERCPFDVVVSDMRLRSTDGITFMNEIKKRHPRCARVLVSGYSDQEEFARCLDATHQFLPKPFDVKLLKATLARLGALDAFLKDPSLQTLAARLGALPSFPSLYVEIMKE